MTTPTAHTTFTEIIIHTAKCDECNKHNKHILYRCNDCGWQCCTPCWRDRGAQGKHIYEREMGGVKVFGEVDNETALKDGDFKDEVEVGASVQGGDEGKKKEGEGTRMGKATAKKATRKRTRVVVDSEDDEDEILAREMGRRRTARGLKRLDYSEKAVLAEEEDVVEAGTGNARSRLRPRQTPKEDSRPIGKRRRQRKAHVPATLPPPRRLRPRIEPHKVATPDYSRDHHGVLMLLEAAEYLERNSGSPSSQATNRQSYSNGANNVQNRSPLFCPDDTELTVEETMLDEEIVKVVEGLRRKRGTANEQTGVFEDGRKRRAKAPQSARQRRAQT